MRSKKGLQPGRSICGQEQTGPDGGEDLGSGERAEEPGAGQPGRAARPQRTLLRGWAANRNIPRPYAGLEVRLGGG